MAVPRKYPAELRERAIRLVLDARAEAGPGSRGACARIGKQLGINPETLRGWVGQAEIGAGARAGVTTDAAARLAEFERENRELRRANEILRSVSAFFAAELAMSAGGRTGSSRRRPAMRHASGWPGSDWASTGLLRDGDLF